jgi:hypothetical protein
MKHDSKCDSGAGMAALGRLLEEHRPKLLAVIQRRLDPALARRMGSEDILSNAFLQARRRWHRRWVKKQSGGVCGPPAVTQLLSLYSGSPRRAADGGNDFALMLIGLVIGAGEEPI